MYLKGCYRSQTNKLTAVITVLLHVYLSHQDAITGDVVHILINLSIQLSGQFNKDPPPVGDPFTLKRTKMQIPHVDKVMRLYILNPQHWAERVVSPFQG